MAPPQNDDEVAAHAHQLACGGDHDRDRIVDPAAVKAKEMAMEREAFLKIVRAMQGYANDACEEVHRWERNFEKLPENHRALLRHHRDKHVEAYRCVSHNDDFFQKMLEAFMGDDVPPHLRVPLPPPKDAPRDPIPPGDVEKVRYVLKNLCRDWSAEAQEERAQCHGPILAELEARLTVPHPDNREGKHPPRVMVGGEGARVAHAGIYQSTQPLKGAPASDDTHA